MIGGEVALHLHSLPPIYSVLLEGRGCGLVFMATTEMPARKLEFTYSFLAPLPSSLLPAACARLGTLRKGF